MEKTIGELFDEYSLLYIKFQKIPQDTELEKRINYLKDIISRHITYLVDNLELNILVNMLLRANKEYFNSLIIIETSEDNWLEESEEIALAAVKLYHSLLVKEKYIKKINNFMRTDI